MCGLAGFLWAGDAVNSAEAERRVGYMADAIRHRGPDAAGRWVDPAAGVALGHRRLEIIELSEAGHQPMISPSGRFVTVYNGEIYNHSDLRRELESTKPAIGWRGHSDTETLAAGLDFWGIEGTLSRAVGMFALAVWDRADRRLTLARDRLGEKPLYYGWQGRGSLAVFLFGSELKALRAHPAFDGQIDRAAIVQLMRHGTIGERNAVFDGICKLAPGELAEVSYESRSVQTRHYWSGAQVTVQERSSLQVAPTPQAATDQLAELLQDAVGRQMMSDVPLGAFLSGGVDSSLVVALMQRLSDRPIDTFSIGFHEKRYNEAEFAKQVSGHIGTRHTELYVGEAELQDVIPLLPAIYDEPFADSSQIPMFLVSRLARQQVSVALSGDGGDELFCGYDRYRQGAAMMRGLSLAPKHLRRLAATGVQAMPSGMWDRLLAPVRRPRPGKEPNGQWLRRLAEYACSGSVDELHRKLVSRWHFPEKIVIAGTEPSGLLGEHLPMRGALGSAERMMQLDMLTYLPDDILTKVDRASMAVSLECRAPFLDHRVVEFAWSLPFEFKFRDGQSKWILRQILDRHVPRELIERPKMGFEVPVGSWLRGPLRDWAEALLEPARLSREGYFVPGVVRQAWAQHLSGKADWGLHIWSILMFQAWLGAQAAASH